MKSKAITVLAVVALLATALLVTQGPGPLVSAGPIEPAGDYSSFSAAVTFYPEADAHVSQVNSDMSGDERAERTFIDTPPLAVMPESVSNAGAEVPLATTNDDELCTDVDIIFIIDCSGTMLTTDADGGVTRLQAAKTAAKAFIDLLPTGTNTRVGVVSFESYGYAEIEQSLTTDFVAAKDAIDDLSIRGWVAMTSIGEGFEKAREELEDHGGANKRVFLLLTDGIANDYPSGWTPPGGWISPPGTWETAEKYAFVEAHSAMVLDAENPTRVYTVGMGEQDDINEDFLEVLAHSSGGEYFFGGTNLVSYMFAEVRADICLGDVTVLILVNRPRMADLYDLSFLDSDPLANALNNALDNLADNNPNGRGVIVDLGYLGNASIDTAYDNWDGHEGDVTRTNNLVDAIDDYIEDLKQDDTDGYPLLRYVIIVGSHEVIPMQARPDDHQWWIDPPGPTPGYWLDERHWADGLPQTFGYLYDIYHAGTHGHYLTDTPYSDLSYRDASADHELSPEIAVARIVETPQQIIDVIDAYMDNGGEIPTNDFVSMASYDYVDGGTQASDYMDATGVATDDTLVDCAYDSTDIPPLLNAQHDIVYLAGHGNYNWITTTDTRDGVSPSSDGFVAGDSATRGCTDDINPIDGAVIVTSGCHNGVNFGNMLYHAPDETYFPTTYSEFPEDFAARGTVAYAGATGYTVITGTECDTDPARTGYNERLATNVVYYVVNGVDIGRAFRNGARDYFRAVQPLSNVHRRVLAIPTLYGIPTYKDSPAEPPSPRETLKAGVGIQKSSYERSGQPAPTSEKITIVISDYTVEASGIVDIPGVEQVVSYNEPILPELFVQKTLPYGSGVSVEWNEGASESVVVANDVPIAGMACREASFPGEFQYDGFWPPSPYQGYGLLTFGAGGSEVGLSINPVQYNEATGKTKIWTKMVFEVQYQVPDTGVSVVSLAADKEQYPSNDTVELSMEISNSTHTRLVDLDVIVRDLNTSDELATLGIGLMGLEGGATTEGSYSIELGDIPAYLIEGKTIEAELVVSDPHNGDILASRSVTFKVVPGVRGIDIYFADAGESPGSVYHYSTGTGVEETVYTRPSGQLYSFSLYHFPLKLYYVNANEYNIYRTVNVGGVWQPEEVVYTHNTYVRDMAFVEENGTLGLYFSEASGAGGNGRIYRVEDGTASLYYEVELADVGGFWAGDFAFDGQRNLYLSSGNTVPASIFKVEDGTVQEIFRDEEESIAGLTYVAGALYYANWDAKIYRLDLGTGNRTAIYSNPQRTWLSDVGVVVSPLVYIEPASATTSISGTTTVDIRIRDVTDLYGVQLYLSFDPSLVEVVDAMPGGDVNIEPGDFLEPGAVVYTNYVDNAAGEIEYVQTREGAVPGMDGSGVLARITFHGKAAGTSSIMFTLHILADPMSVPIEHDHADGEIVVRGMGSVSGRVILERRVNYPNANAGATVELATQSQVTSDDGTYSFSNVPAGTHQIRVTHPSYLPTWRDVTVTAGGTIMLPDVTLLGGDCSATQGIVDGVDAVVMGKAWGSQPGDPNWKSRADVRDDSVIDVLDFTAVKFNWLSVAPGPWPGAALAAEAPQQQAGAGPLMAELAAATAVVISPTMVTTSIGVPAMVEVWVQDVEDLYGGGFQLQFDASVVNVQDANPFEDGVQIESGSWLERQLEAANSVDNDQGEIDFFVTQRYPATAKSGSGVLARITFVGMAEGSTTLHFDSVQLVDDDENEIAASTEDGSVVVEAGYRVYLPVVLREASTQ